MKQNIRDLMEANPIIAAVKSMEGLDVCLAVGGVKIVFLLFGDVCNIGEIVKRVQNSGRIAMVHVDLIGGLSSKEVAIDFLAHTVHADGIISTKPTMLKRAKELSLYTVLRIFMLDSMAFENLEKQVDTARPDVIEILPGLMPKIIKRVTRSVRIPVIAGGLIAEKEDVMEALGMGAISISTTNTDVWKM